MRDAGLAGVSRRKRTVTTVRDGARQAPEANMLRVTKHAAVLADAHGAEFPGPRKDILKEVPVNCLIMTDAEAADG
jgi:hypothetical protein